MRTSNNRIALSLLKILQDKNFTFYPPLKSRDINLEKHSSRDKGTSDFYFTPNPDKSGHLNTQKIQAAEGETARETTTPTEALCESWRPKDSGQRSTQTRG